MTDKEQPSNGAQNIPSNTDDAPLIGSQVDEIGENIKKGTWERGCQGNAVAMGTPKSFHRNRTKSIHDSMISGLDDFSGIPKAPPDISEYDEAMEEKLKLKDRGYSWVIVSSFFMVNINLAGLVLSLGLISSSMLDSIHGATPTTVSFIAGLNIGLRGLLAPFASLLCSYAGERRSMLIGAFIAVAGIFITAVAPSITLMIVGFGGMVGIGAPLLAIPQVQVTAYYFRKKLSTATGIRIAGLPLGGVLLPPLTVFLIDTYGLRYALVGLAALYANNFVLVSLARPYTIHRKIKINEYNRDVTDPQEKIKLTNDSSSKNQIKNGNPKNKLDFKTFLSVDFICYVLVSFLRALAIPTVFYFIPFWGKEAGMTPYESSIVISIASAMDFIFRLSVGILSDKIKFNKGRLIATGLIAAGLAVSLIPYTYSVLPMALLLCIIQCSSAIFIVLYNVIFSENYTPELAGAAWGLTRMSFGIGNLIFPSLLGAVWQSSGSFYVVFGIMGSGMILAGILMELTPILHGCISKPNDIIDR